MASGQIVRVGRIYAAAEAGEGARLLVDRLWPRGVSKEAAALDEWCRDVAPSNGLRRWYGHDPARFGEFTQRYRQELAEPEGSAALGRLRDWHQRGPVILLTATKTVEISHADVLAVILRDG
jgi:uncharacterized protein YeaO (DUF488 family)